MKIHTTHTTHTATYDIRATMYDGKEYIIVPVVMMREGVHSGSHGSLFHSAEELGRYPAAWDGRPVVIHHPEVNGKPVSANRPDVSQNEKIGYVFNTQLDGDKLKADAWLCLERFKQISPETLEHIESHKPLDVSVGVFTDKEAVSGTWNGESYAAIAHNHRPDHLAILPGGTGACSFADGCGIRNNSQKNNENVEISEKVNNAIEVFKKTQFVQSDLNVNETDYKQLQQGIQQKLDRMDTDNKVHWLVVLYGDRVIYKVNSEADEDYYQRSYEVMDNDEVEFGTDVQKMRFTYQPVAQNNKFKRSINTNNGGNMTDVKKCCPDKVDELIANKATKFTEDDKDWLLTQSVETIEKMFPIKQEPEQVSVNKEQALEVLKKQLSDKEQVLDMLPREMKAQFEYGLNAYQAERTKLISGIVKNSNEQFKGEDLKSMDMPMLQKMYKSVVRPDYSVANGDTGSEVNVNSEYDGVEPLLPPGMETEEK
jgi:hypothetical protein